jgi:NAD(P)H-nitrite reductase large subunit
MSLWRHPEKLAQAASLAWRLRGIRYRHGTHVAAALGRERLRAVRLQGPDRNIKIECEWLGVGYGLLPNLELARLLGCRIEADAVAVDAYLRTSLEHVFAAGEVTGVGGVDKAWHEGRLAAQSALGLAASVHDDRHRRYQRLLARHFHLAPAITRLAEPNTLVCRCEDVPFGALTGMADLREAKLQTRCGMGPCQGRICGAACQTLFGWQSGTPRPPLQPTRLSTLAELE